MTTDLRNAIREKAASLGFDALGIARADELLGVEHDRYKALVAAGMHGTMSYVADNAEARRRLDTSDILEGAKSIICVGRRCARAPADEAKYPPLAQSIARYARGQVYHVFLRKKVRELASFVRSLGEGVTARVVPDVEPVIERAWAAPSGLGFIGKNGLVITPGARKLPAPRRGRDDASLGPSRRGSERTTSSRESPDAWRRGATASMCTAACASRPKMTKDANGSSATPAAEARTG